MEERYLICEDSLEGIFTGIYQAYLMKLPRERVHLCTEQEENYRLFAVYENCPVDADRAGKVARTILRRFGQEGYLDICRALASPEKDKADAVYRTVVTGLSMKNPGEVMGNLADSFVHRVFQLARSAANEAHAHVEFIRFQELEGGALYAPMSPKNNIITFIMPHFADRLPLENFIIHDQGRNIFAVHPARKNWYLVHEDENMGDTEKKEQYPTWQLSVGEQEYRELFLAFFHTIPIKERANNSLQRNMLPIRYRKYMTEFLG